MSVELSLKNIREEQFSFDDLSLVEDEWKGMLSAYLMATKIWMTNISVRVTIGFIATEFDFFQQNLELASLEQWWS